MTKIVIPEPCHEDWKKMSSSEKGRFCQSCEKEVVDFTKKSKDEIVQHLKAAPGRTCGRFLADQIHKEVACTDTLETSDPLTWNFWFKVKSIGMSVLAFFGFTMIGQSDAKAQRMGKVRMSGEVKMVENTDERVRTEVTVVEGTVRSIFGGGALAKANISIESNGRLIGNAFTDDNGKYRIVLRGGVVTNGKITVRAYAKEYSTVSVEDIVIEKTQITVDLNLEDQYVMMGDVAYIPEEESKVVQTDIIEEVKVTEATIEHVKGNALPVETVTKTVCTKGLENPVNNEGEIPEEQVYELGEVEMPVEQHLQLGQAVMMVDEIEETLLVDGIMEVPEVVVEIEEEIIYVEGIEEEVELTVIEEEIIEVELPIVPIHGFLTPENKEPEIATREEGNEGDPQTPEHTSEPTDATLPRVAEAPKLVSVLYPNPSSNESIIEMNTEGDYRIQLYDNTGKLVSDAKFNGRRHTLDLLQVKPGVYHVRVTDVSKAYAQPIELVVSR